MTARKTILFPLILGLALLVGCARKPVDKGLTKDLEHIIPAEPATPATVALAPPGSTVVYGDPYVVVALLKLGPGDAIPEHQVKDAVLYAPEATKIGIARDGNESTLELAEGDALLLDPGAYAFDNPGSQSVELVFVERSKTALPPLPPEFAPFGSAERDGGDVVLEAGPARVVATTIAPQESFALDAVPLRVFFALDPANLAVTDANQATSPLQLDAGAAGVRTGIDVGVTNRAANATRVVLFEFRS
jgi:hypothetical protein